MGQLGGAWDVGCKNCVRSGDSGGFMRLVLRHSWERDAEQLPKTLDVDLNVADAIGASVPGVLHLW